MCSRLLTGRRCVAQTQRERREEDKHMIPGELCIKDGEIELNKGRKSIVVSVSNTGDRPIQVGSHYHSSKPTRR